MYMHVHVHVCMYMYVITVEWQAVNLIIGNFAFAPIVCGVCSAVCFALSWLMELSWYSL